MTHEAARITPETYLELITETVRRVGGEQAPAVRKAARLITDALADDGILHAFGSGHSEALAMELAGRAGGLVPTNRIAMRDLVLYGDQPRSVLEDPLLERNPAIARRLLETAAVRPTDVFVVASNSGINGVVVEFALQAKERGHRLIAITSADHSAKSQPRHPSGRRLGDLADVVLDNGAPYGDAALPLPGGGAFGAVKLVADGETGRLLGVHIAAEAAGEMILAGVYALKAGMTVTDLTDEWAPYLTEAEAIKLAAQAFTTDVAKLSCCAA